MGYEFNWNGTFDFGAGTPFPVNSIDGLAGLPDLRTQDDNRGYIDGTYSGRDFYSARNIVLNITTLAGDSNSAQENYEILKYNLAPQQSGIPSNLKPLEFDLNTGQTYTIWGRIRSNLTAIDPEFTYGYIRSLVSIYCPDGRYYGPLNEVLVPDTLIPVDNSTGSAATEPTIRLTNPGGPFSIMATYTEGLGTINQTMNFDSTGSSGSNVEIDLNQRTITIDGVPYRQILLGDSVWIQVPPVFVQFSSTVNMTMEWRVAYV